MNNSLIDEIKVDSDVPTERDAYISNKSDPKRNKVA
jgi:hypothetical protein